jgi:hypothetical protein
VNITLSLDDELVRKVRKIAVDRDSTLTGMVREYLEKLAAEDAASARRRRQIDALERSFHALPPATGTRDWTRAGFHERS